MLPPFSPTSLPWLLQELTLRMQDHSLGAPRAVARPGDFLEPFPDSWFPHRIPDSLEICRCLTGSLMRLGRMTSITCECRAGEGLGGSGCRWVARSAQPHRQHDQAGTGPFLMGVLGDSPQPSSTLFPSFQLTVEMFDYLECELNLFQTGKGRHCSETWWSERSAGVQPLSGADPSWMRL